MLVGRCLIVYFLLPLFFRGKLFTAYEVLHQRFGGATQKVASLVFLVARNVGDGLRLFLTAIVVQQMIGGSLALCVVIVGLTTIVYTFLGGIKSVIWTDCVQFVVYVGGGVLVVVVHLCRLPGGWAQFCSFAESTGKLRCFDAASDLHLRFTFWSGLVGGACLSLGTHGTDQIMVQRYLCAQSAGCGVGVGLQRCGRDPAVRAVSAAGSGVGLFLHARGAGREFRQFGPCLQHLHCERDARGLRPGGRDSGGHFLRRHVDAVEFAEFVRLGRRQRFLSTELEDPNRRDRQLLWASRAHRGVRVLQIAIGLAAQFLADAVINNVLTIAGFTAGVLVGVVRVGVLTRRVGQRAALVGLFAGVVVLTYVKFGTSVAYTWYALIGSLVTFLVGCAGFLGVAHERHVGRDT